MKCSCVVIVLLLAIVTASRVSLAADGESSRIPAIVERELKGLIARADNIFRSAGWHTAKATTDDIAEAKNLRAVAAARRRPRKSAGASCVTAAMCRKKRVICGKRCYGASRARLTHVPSRCVVKCKKCVPTC